MTAGNGLINIVNIVKILFAATSSSAATCEFQHSSLSGRSFQVRVQRRPQQRLELFSIRSAERSLGSHLSTDCGQAFVDNLVLPKSPRGPLVAGIKPQKVWESSYYSSSLRPQIRVEKNAMVKSGRDFGLG